MCLPITAPIVSHKGCKLNTNDYTNNSQSTLLFLHPELSTIVDYSLCLKIKQITPAAGVNKEK